jgi:plastocyanin
MRFASRAALAFVGLSLGFTGCKSAPLPSNGDGPSASKPPSVTEGNTQARVPVTGPTGAIAGVVSFNGKASTATIDTSMDPACSLGGGDGTLKTEQFVANGGKLANVFVYVKTGPAAAMQAAPPTSNPVVMDQRNCRYVPHVIGVMQGGTVEFHNSDPTMHNIHAMPAEAADSIDVSQGPRGAAQMKRFPAAELMIPVRCNNHPWMNAFINVSATPFFAVTGEDGKFELKGLPPGDYVLGAVHEKLPEQTLAVHVSANATSKGVFSFASK